jgi:hypothetical protein
MTRLTSRTADMAVLIIMFDLIAFLVSTLSFCLPLYPGESVLTTQGSFHWPGSANQVQVYDGLRHHNPGAFVLACCAPWETIIEENMRQRQFSQ